MRHKELGASLRYYLQNPISFDAVLDMEQRQIELYRELVGSRLTFDEYRLAHMNLPVIDGVVIERTEPLYGSLREAGIPHDLSMSETNHERMHLNEAVNQGLSGSFFVTFTKDSEGQLRIHSKVRIKFQKGDNEFAVKVRKAISAPKDLSSLDKAFLSED